MSTLNMGTVISVNLRYTNQLDEDVDNTNVQTNGKDWIKLGRTYHPYLYYY